MSESYPRRDQARGIWKINDITKNIKELGTYPGAAKFMALCGGGYSGSNSNVIDEFNMITAGNAIDFGDLVTARSGCSTNSSNIRIVWSGGETSSNFSQQDYVHFATKGNAADFGDLSTAQGNTTKGSGNEVKAVTSSGSGDSDLLNTFIFATLGSSTSFGNLTTGRNGAPQGTTDGVRGTYSGGMAPNQSNVIDFIEITTNGNATDFGDLSVARGEASSADSKTRSVIFSGRTNSPSPGTIADVIDFFETASQGNATDFGDMNVPRKGMAGGLSNSIKGFSAGGTASPGNTNSIEQITFATRSNGSDFGDLTVARSACPGNTSSHGGLQGFHPRAPELYSPTGKIVPSGFGQGDLGVYNGGEAPSGTNVIDFIQISNIGNARDFGDLTAANAIGGAVSSATRYVTIGDNDANLNTYYLEFRTKGNTAFFGDLTVRGYAGAGGSNSTRGINYGRANPATSGTANETIDYITIASIGNWTDFGNCNVASYFNGGTNSDTRMVKCGGITEGPNTITDSMEYVTMASTGNGTDFGNLIEASGNWGCGNVSNGTRGVFSGGAINPANNINTNVIQYITIASTGNTTDFGDLTVARRQVASSCNSTRGVYAGGETPSNSNIMDYITIGSTGNAIDYGDLTISVSRHGGASNGHGGLS